IELRDYEAPQTLHTIIEMEDGVCNASPAVHNPDKDGRIEAHKYNNDFGFDFELNEGEKYPSWD
ncbi:MAG: hypothetical protein HUJ83_10185, partial [Veillonella sp.]|nr:hypothetical protein [Veillonella sp.]